MCYNENSDQLNLPELYIWTILTFMNPLKKGQLREEYRYMWGCGLRPHPHIYSSLLLALVFLVHSFIV